MGVAALVLPPCDPLTVCATVECLFPWHYQPAAVLPPQNRLLHLPRHMRRCRLKLSRWARACMSRVSRRRDLASVLRQGGLQEMTSKYGVHEARPN